MRIKKYEKIFLSIVYFKADGFELRKTVRVTLLRLPEGVMTMVRRILFSPFGTRMIIGPVYS